EIDEIDFIHSLCIYLPIFIILHELGHISFFHLFGKKIDKIGFKFNYIFPSFFVRMNDTYLLSKKERLIVHSGGMMFSLLINTIVFLLGIILNNILLVYLAKYMSIDIIFNSLPIMNSDGYKVILSLKGIEEKKNFEENSCFIQIIKTVNILLAIVYTIWFIWSL
ncbi:TPA: peptidase, partial [Streptococcus suis]